MTSRRLPTRIELHRLKFHWSGGSIVPIFMHQLTDEEISMILEDVSLYNGSGKRDKSFREQILEDWGVLC